MSFVRMEMDVEGGSYRRKHLCRPLRGLRELVERQSEFLVGKQEVVGSLRRF